MDADGGVLEMLSVFNGAKIAEDRPLDAEGHRRTFMAEGQQK